MVLLACAPLQFLGVTRKSAPYRFCRLMLPGRGDVTVRRHDGGKDSVQDDHGPTHRSPIRPQSSAMFSFVVRSRSSMDDNASAIFSVAAALAPSVTVVFMAS